MKTVVVIVIVLTILYLIIRYYREKRTKKLSGSTLKDERTFEEIMDGRSADEVYRELDEKEFDELTDIERDMQLALITHSEHTWMQASAVKELIESTSPIDASNQYREPIDFTLRFYEKNIRARKGETLEHINSHFPLMGKYIIKKVCNSFSNTEHNPDDSLNYSKCYDEFLFFIKHFFLKKYPEKEDRDYSMHKHFPRTADGLIDFIER